MFRLRPYQGRDRHHGRPLQVDDFVGSQFTQEVVMAGRGGCDDLCASPVSKLDSKDCNASCRSVNEDGLPCDQPRVIKERLLGRQSSNRSADCRHIIERARLGY
jgi:hypothetical protein